MTIEYRWADGHYDRLPAMAADLVGRRVDVIATRSGTPAALRRKRDLDDPDRLLFGGDPVELGLVASFARPGGNLTGVSVLTAELTQSASS